MVFKGNNDLGRVPLLVVVTEDAHTCTQTHTHTLSHTVSVFCLRPEPMPRQRRKRVAPQRIRSPRED